MYKKSELDAQQELLILSALNVFTGTWDFEKLVRYSKWF